MPARSAYARRLQTFAALLLVAALVSACSWGHKTPADTLAARHEIIKATDAWVDAYNSRDPERILALYAVDAVFWGTSAKSIATTLEQIAEYFKDAPKRPRARVRITERQVRVLGDVAYTSGSYTFSNYEGEKLLEMPARFTFIFQKQKGKWLIVHQHSSRVTGR
jgi:uncharacterized protein (TIGR02246 family)